MTSPWWSGASLTPATTGGATSPPARMFYWPREQDQQGILEPETRRGTPVVLLPRSLWVPWSPEVTPPTQRWGGRAPAGRGAPHPLLPARQVQLHYLQLISTISKPPWLGQLGPTGAGQEAPCWSGGSTRMLLSPRKWSECYLSSDGSPSSSGGKSVHPAGHQRRPDCGRGGAGGEPRRATGGQPAPGGLPQALRPHEEEGPVVGLVT